MSANTNQAIWWVVRAGAHGEQDKTFLKDGPLVIDEATLVSSDHRSRPVEGRTDDAKTMGRKRT